MSKSHTYQLVIRKDDESLISKKDRDLLNENKIDILHLEHVSTNNLKSDIVTLLFLPDENIKKLIPKLKQYNCIIGFLPHPSSPNIINGFSINTNLTQALNEIMDTVEVMESDLLYCNEEPVLNYVAIGDIMNFLTRKNTKGWWYGWKNLIRFLKKLRHLKAKLITLSSSTKEPIETAFTDALIVQHGKNALVSRLLLEKSYINDQMFHTFIFAPRSMMQLINAYFLKLFLGNSQTNTAFDFLGHIKGQDLTINLSQNNKYTIDDKTIESNELILQIKPGLKIIPSKALLFSSHEEDRKALFRVDQLPKGEAKKEMISKSLPWIKHASTEEYKELFTQLRENAKPRQTYVVLMILSTLLATFGLFSNSSPVIIGAMILAPLMSPIISMSMGVLRQDHKLMKSSIITILIGLGVGYLFAILLTIITPLSDLNTEITARTNPNIIDLGVAVVSGIAGAYAHAKEQIAKTLAGVAIAVALVPPLAVSGIGIGWGNWEVFFGSFLLLLTNLTGMVLAGSLTFLLVGYSPFKLAKKGLLISFFVVLALSIPLGYGFVKVVQENKIINSINHYLVDEVEIKDVAIIQYNPLTLSINLVSEESIDDAKINKIKREIEDVLQKEVALEVSFTVRK